MDLRLPFLGEVDKVPTTVGDMTHALTFLVVNDTQFSLMIERAAMKRMRASLDFVKHISTFWLEEQVVTKPLWTDKEKNGRSLSKVFTAEEKRHSWAKYGGEWARIE